MDIQKKEYLKGLKEKNKVYQEQMNIKNNILLKECITALSCNALLLNDSERNNIYKFFKEKIPFSPWGINWSLFNDTKVVEKKDNIYDNCINKEFYIIWNKDLPIIKCDICTIIRYYDEISSVEPDTWILSSNFKEIIEFHHEGKITVGLLNKILLEFELNDDVK